ncbi:Ff.00g112830.m01.CDS01 [Fusarium sp. VM40]|nr:Ff.00g112830.m01.CDS01 [Fusarium sp. VM40]
MSNHVDESSSPDQPSSDEDFPDAPSSLEPSSSSEEPSEERSTRESDSLRSTPEQQPHPADRVHRFYPGVNNRYGGIAHSDLVVQDPETRLSHLQYAVQESPGTTSFVTDKSTIVAIIEFKYRNDESGKLQPYWDISFGHGCEYNHTESYPASTAMTDTCGDVRAFFAALMIIKARSLGTPLRSQVYIATDSETLVGLLTGPEERDESHVGE